MSASLFGKGLINGYQRSLGAFCILMLLPWQGIEASEYDSPYLFTKPITTPFGCLYEAPRAGSVPYELEFEETILVPGPIGQARFDVKGWRTACPSGERSVAVFQIAHSFPYWPIFRLPDVYVRSVPTGPWVEARLVAFPDPFDAGAVIPGTFLGASGTAEPVEGVGDTYIVEVSTEILSTEQYNASLELILDWGVSAVQEELIYRAFSPDVHLPQFDAPPFHGRHSGQWIVEGMPRQGLVLQVGEVGDRNFVFAVLFTYLNGAPIWIAGNADIPREASEITFEAFRFEGGEFFGADSYDESEVAGESLGTMTLRVDSCNSIHGDFDFGASGLGDISLDFERLIRIAGYDCDHTR